jgi:hypothetical protein
MMDFRDFSHENNFIFKFIISLIIKKSILTLLSSEGFRKKLFSNKNMISIHNYNRRLLENMDISKDFRNNNDKIIIRYWGLIRHFEVNRSMIEMVSKDPRFELYYHGRQQQDAIKLINYSKSIQSRNVFFIGDYLPDDRINFAKMTHLLLNMYENNFRTIYSTGNKYYDGLILGLPQICTQKSFMGFLVSKHKIGLEVDPNDKEMLSKIHSFIRNLNYDEFDLNRKAEIKRVENEQISALYQIKKFIGLL